MRRPVWLLVLAALCCSRRLAEVDRTEFGFGSYVRIKALAPDKAALDDAVQRAFEEMFRLDTLWSSFLPNSEVALLNRTGGAAVSSDTRELVSEALRVCAATDGALDITIRPVLDAWGITGQEKPEVRSQESGIGSGGEFSPQITQIGSGKESAESAKSADGNWQVPDSAELARVRRLVDYRQVLVRGDSVILAGGAQIDLGAVAVGFAVDRAVEMLRAAGVKQGLIDAGGDIMVFGDREWKIGLRNPRRPEQTEHKDGKASRMPQEDVIRVFRVKDRAVSTSGDYQKFFEKDGRRYHHIIDPSTGYPADKCASVTILAPTTLAADAFATAVFVLGPEEGLQKVREQEGMAVVMLAENGDSLETYEAGTLR